MAIYLGDGNNKFPNNNYPNNSGNNTVYGKKGNDTLDGGPGQDKLYGQEGKDILLGQDGNDTLYGGDGYDSLDGGPGQDELHGQDGGDTLFGQDGNDTLYGGQGDDSLNGGNGNDRLVATTDRNDDGSDIWRGGPGADLFDIGRFDKKGREDSTTIMDFNYNEGDRIYNLDSYNLSELNNSVDIKTKSGNPLANVIKTTIADLKGIKFCTVPVTTNEDVGTIYINPILSFGSTSLNVTDVSSSRGVSVSPSGSRVKYSLGSQFNYLRQNQSVSDTLNITLRDAQGYTYSVPFPNKVYIQGLNDAPIPYSDSYEINENTSFAHFDVLNNDTDPDSGDGKYLVSETSDSANISGNKIIYNPSKFNSLRAGQTKIDNFSYTMRDSQGFQRSTTVKVSVYGANDAPIPVNDVVNVSEKDNSVTINVLGNDTDPDQGETGLLSLVEESSGNATISGNRIVYTIPKVYLGEGQVQTETFTYRIKDPSGATRTANVSVNITGVNDAPMAKNDTGETNEDSTTLINVLNNDVDLDLGDTKTIVSVDSSNIEGKVAIVNNQIQYDPRGIFDHLQTGETVNESFPYVMKDSQEVEGTASITVSVKGINDSPVLNIAGNPALEPGGSYIGEIVPDGSITDVDNSVTKAIAVVQVSLLNGTWQYFHNGQWLDFNSVSQSNARLLDANNKIPFIPSGNETVNASLKYSAWDQTEGVVGGTANVALSNLLEGNASAYSSAFETVDITIKPPNPPPTDIILTNVNNPVDENQNPGVLVGTLSTVDNPGDSHSYQ